MESISSICIEISSFDINFKNYPSSYDFGLIMPNTVISETFDQVLMITFEYVYLNKFQLSILKLNAMYEQQSLPNTVVAA